MFLLYRCFKGYQCHDLKLMDGHHLSKKGLWERGSKKLAKKLNPKASFRPTYAFQQ